MISRVERTRFANWWWTVDRLMLAAIAVLMMTGIVLSLAASPAVATRIGLDAFYFVNRHAIYLAPTFLVMIAVSFLSPRQIRRLALVVFIVAVAMTAATLVIGADVKGARRWIVLAGVNIQPSEFLKPAFVILISSSRHASPTCRRTRWRSACSLPWSCRWCCSPISARLC
jgi:cell division protein FtsW